MMARCYDSNHGGYHNYGARGITVWLPWHDVSTFIGWVEKNLGYRPDGMTLDRSDNNLGYQPGNLRWATRAEQNANQRPGLRPHGTAKSQSRLTETVVEECRRRWRAGEPQKNLATEFGVSRPTMHKAIVGKTWRHV